MTNEERDIINQFIARVGGGQPQAQPAFGGSVPATTTPALPPVDPEADRLIGDLLNRYPDARYRITQLAFVQEHALAEAQNRIQRLEWEVQQARQQAQQAQQQQSTGSGGGFFSGLFGGGSRSAPPPQQGRAGVEPGRPQPSYQQAAAAAAAIRAELSARHVPAPRLRVPRLRADHGGRCRRRPGRGQCADEPVLRFARWWLRRWFRRRRANGGQSVGQPVAPIRATWTRAPGRTIPLAASPTPDMSTTVRGIPRALTNRRCRTTAAIPVGTTTAAAGRATTRSDLTGGA